VTIPLPNIGEPGGSIVWGFITEFHVREDSRVTEEGVGVKSDPQV